MTFINWTAIIKKGGKEIYQCVRCGKEVDRMETIGDFVYGCDAPHICFECYKEWAKICKYRVKAIMIMFDKNNDFTLWRRK